MDKVLRIHGRSSLKRKVWYRDDATGQLVDLSDKALVFETDGAAFRKPLGFTDDPTIRELYLRCEEVDQLPTITTGYIIRDETVAGMEGILGTGQIKRIGWVGP